MSLMVALFRVFPVNCIARGDNLKYFDSGMSVRFISEGA